MNGHDPRIEKLLFTDWKTRFAPAIPTDAATIEKSWFVYEHARELVEAGTYPTGLNEDGWRFVRMNDLIDRGQVFVLDPMDVPPDLLEPQEDEEPSLPPCAFPSMFIEFWSREHACPVPLTPVTDLDRDHCFISGLVINEKIPSRLWHCFWILESPDYTPGDYALREFSLEVRDGAWHFGTRVDEIARSGVTNEELLMWKLTVGALMPAVVETINVVGAKHEPMQIPRQHRRQFQREHGVEHPTVYKVDLHSAGEPSEGYGGTREFRHRWMVRGHYVKNPNGQFDVPGKGKCHWRRPYVKGPAGAPWKGRQVRVG